MHQEQEIEVDGRKQTLNNTFAVGVGVPMAVKFNPGNMAKPIFRGYGYHCTDYDKHKAK